MKLLPSFLALALTTSLAQAQTPPLLRPEVLRNGTLLVTRPDRIAPRVAISLLVRAGASDETPENAGWRRLLAETMLRGFRPVEGEDAVLTTRDWSKRAEELGGRIGVTVADDAIEIYALGDSEQTGPLVQLMLGLARRPRLSDDDIEAARTRLLDRIDKNDDNEVASRAVETLHRHLYRNAKGEAVAYGLPPQGTRASLQSLTPQALRDLHAKFFVPSRWVVGASGDVDEDTLRALLGAGEEGDPLSAPERPFFAPISGAEPPLVVGQMPSQSAWVVAGFALSGLNAGDAAALRVLAAALGEAPGARLKTRFARKTPMGTPNDDAVEQVFTQWTPRRFSSELIVLAQTGTQDVEETKNLLLDEIRRTRQTPLSPRELIAAKNFARGSWAIEREALRERAFQAALATALDAPSDTSWPSRLEAVTAADVQRAAQKYLGDYAVALIMPQD